MSQTGKTNKASGFMFIDTSRVIYIFNDDEKVMNYKIDFTKQPITFDLDSGQGILQCYLGFYNNEVLRIQMFKPGKERAEHFTFFGHNAVLKRQPDKVAATVN